MKDWIRNLRSIDFAGKYSQSFQDGLIDSVFANIGVANDPPFCVEFGFNSSSLTAGSGANVSKLVLDHRWRSLLLDGDFENHDINLFKYYLTTENICEIFEQCGVPVEPDYVSVDVDSTDLWLLDKLLSRYRARLFSVEYNSNFPLYRAITIRNHPSKAWQADRGYGASLKALNMVAQRHGYSLLWVVKYLDAFFVRNDLIDDGSSQLVSPFSTWRNMTSSGCHKPVSDSSRLADFIDYEVYCATDGDLDQSRHAAAGVCRSVLLRNPIRAISQRLRNKAKKAISLCNLSVNNNQ
jgi:hypothetical protein